jgi:hypothetical protein
MGITKGLTEAGWLACTELRQLLEQLGRKATQRKLRLFATACCRRIWHLLPDERSRAAVEVAEQFADKQATHKERQTAESAASEAEVQWRRSAKGEAEAAYAAFCTISWEPPGHSWPPHGPEMARVAANCAVRAVRGAMAWLPPKDPGEAERAAQIRLLRDLFGNPFRPAPFFPSWLTYNDGILPKLAQGIYDDRAFDRLPILADVLEEASCTHPDILAHCRGGGEHARGCWVLDRLLVKS